MSQNSNEPIRLSGGGDIGSESPSNSNLVGDDGSRQHDNPSVSLMGSSPTNTNITNPTGHPSQRLTRRKSYQPSSENVSNDEDNDDDDDDDNDDTSSRGNNKRKGLKSRPSYRRHKSGSSRNNEYWEEPYNDDENADDESIDESDHEPTLKDRQDAINTTHPFGFSLWKPALYKKSRSVTRNVNSALHSTPTADFFLYPGNIIWAVIFGWLLALISLIVSVFLSLTPGGGSKYARVLRELSYYIFWPFGRYVERLEVDDEEWFAGEDLRRQQQEHVGSMNHNEFFMARDTSTILTGIGSEGGGSEGAGGYTTDEEVNGENRPLLGRNNRRESKRKNNGARRNFNLFQKIKEIGFAGVVFYFWYFLVIAPMFLLVSALCWLCIFSLPMAKLTFLLSRHLRRYPLSLHFKPGSSLTLDTDRRSLILLCTYKAFGLQYFKYTYDGINIFFINLMPLVIFVIIDYSLLTKIFEGKDYFFITEKFLFTLSLISVIPLSYFIGMAVASISAQSSAGYGAVINATFGSIIEIILYAITLVQGKGKVAEGSIIGSLMAGVLLMPGVSMISGGFKRKEQKFNAKSAGVTSTMLIMAIIGALTPTLFYQTYAPYRMTCVPCKGYTELTPECQVCTHIQVNPTSTSLYKEHVKPLMFFCAFILLLSYIIGLWFTLRTHVALVWQTGHHHSFVDNPRPTSIYKKIIPEYILQQILPHPNPNHNPNHLHTHSHPNPNPNHLHTHTHPHPNPNNPPHQQSLHHAPNTLAAPSNTVPQRPLSAPGPSSNIHDHHNMHNLDSITATLSSQNHPIPPANLSLIRFAHEPEEEEETGGHDSPNWSKVKSGIVLLSCTAIYSLIAEILVENVEVILNALDNFKITEKLLGLTLFALVPNVTEFVNAMAFALYGNIALSMEIGSAYALQVCLLQIPAMVAFSAWYNADKSDEEDTSNSTFTLVFPRWDVFSVVFSVFLLTYTYIEGKSNYFKGSILILSYLVLMAGFFSAPDNDVQNY